MSTALALGAVTAVLRNVLDNGLVDAAPAVGAPVKVTAVAPDLVKLDEAAAPPQLNLFLYRVSANVGWQHVDLPSRAADGIRTARPPLAVDLHYLVTAYGRTDLQAEILLGYALHLMHERPWLDRDTVRKALSLTPLDPSILPDAFRSPANAGLADQVEGLKIIWEPLDIEALSKLWSAFQAHYRPSAAYQVSVVLIESTAPARVPLPVLSRKADVVPSLVPPYPTVEAIEPVAGQPAARLGEQITIKGHHLAGTQVAVHFAHQLVAQPHVVPVGTHTDEHTLTVTVPANAPTDWPAGVWSVTVHLVPPDDPVARDSNVAALLLAPVLALPPATVNRDGGTGAVTVAVGISPPVRPEQAVRLVVGTTEAGRTVFPANPGDPVEFVFAALPSGVQPVRARVDGVESVYLDRSTTPPTFVAGQSVSVP